MEKKKVKYSEGDLFILETENHAKFLGLLARRKGRSKLLFGYFWVLNFDINDDLLLNKNKAITATKFSGLGFELGSWTIIGKYSRWNKNDWPIPEFRRYSELIDKYYAISYNEDFEEIAMRNISEEEAKLLFKDGSHGYISLENYLQKHFSEK